ncbi:hypothetical protein PHMEG_00015541 [Phytophthora megakarya]|uniref:Uncharacterized protein n=1 Tax=Phytophthora megakarya TaxID=4795 RepID=A0A225W1I5_9STRA|nr:hypothetical protein PHMEG_00015541 [Phytophthora megakarya]
MTYSIDLRWRGIVLMYVYSIDTATVASVLGYSERSLNRCYQRFRRTGNVTKTEARTKTSRWPPDVCAFVQQYVKAHPCFYFEELRYELRTRFKALFVCQTLQYVALYGLT